MDYPRLLSRFYGQPLALCPNKAAVIHSVLNAYVTGKAPQPADKGMEAREVAYSADSPRFQARKNKPYAMTDSGIAIIPIMGSLVQRSAGLDPLSGMMSYHQIGSQINAALNDGDVRAMLLEIDSPGGEVFGLADCASQIKMASTEKPVWAAINEQAYSAAYYLAASATRIIIPVSGATGSIGTIALHVDQSKRDATQGYSYTYIYAGARKKDMNPHEPLSRGAREAVQLEVDRHYGLFVGHVARSRGLSERAVRATEAAVLTPAMALHGGFVDAIASFTDALDMLQASLSTAAV